MLEVNQSFISERIFFLDWSMAILLWQVMEQLVDVVYYLHQEICDNFGSEGMDDAVLT